MEGQKLTPSAPFSSHSDGCNVWVITLSEICAELTYTRRRQHDLRESARSGYSVGARLQLTLPSARRSALASSSVTSAKQSLDTDRTITEEVRKARFGMQRVSPDSSLALEQLAQAAASALSLTTLRSALLRRCVSCQG